MTVVTRVPGKLFIAGEYAVTTGKSPAIIAPVPRFLTVTMTEQASGRITSEQWQQPLHFTRQDGMLCFEDFAEAVLVQEAICVVEQYIRECGLPTTQLFHLSIQSELDDRLTQQKYGLGSSGAVTVAVIQAILEWYHYPFTPMHVYKLACLTHLNLGSKGSFGDLAVSAFQCLLLYQLFDKAWVQSQRQQVSIKSLITLDWPNLRIEPLQWVSSSRFLVGWTGTPASTEQLVADVKQFQHTKDYAWFVKASAQCVQHLAAAIQQQDEEQMAVAVRNNRLLLQQLSPYIETEKLRVLCDIAEQFGAASKVSGAGGGDCGICLVQENQEEVICQFWRENGISPLFTLGGFYDLSTIKS